MSLKQFVLLKSQKNRTYYGVIVALLALISSALMQLDDPIQQLFTSANQSEFEFKISAGLFAFHAFLWMTGNRWLSCLIITVFALLQVGQLGHMSYVGRPLDPLTISSVFTEGSYITQVMSSGLSHHLHVLLAVGLPYSVLLFMFWHLMPASRHPAWKWLCYVLIVLSLLSKPHRAWSRDINLILPSPTRPSLYNSLDTYSFLLVQGFPNINEVTPLAPIPKPELQAVPTSSAHVWLIIVDSLRSDHMGIYGYERSNTPHLQTWVQQGMSVHQGISSSVATASSVPLLMNTIYDPGNLLQIKSEQTNLFKLAHDQGFKTFWVSSQSSRILNDLGTSYIDVSIDQNDGAEIFGNIQDHDILEVLKQQDFSQKSFTVILLRGVHAPYQANYAHARERYVQWPDGDDLNRRQQGRNAYDNAVLYADNTLNDLLDFIAQQSGERHVVITSDHGQLLGERGAWGHNILARPVITVPMLSQSWNASSDRSLKAWAGNKPWISHFEMSSWIAQQLGTHITLPQYQPSLTYVQGKNLYGINRYIEVTEDETQVVHLSNPKITRQYVPHIP